MKKHIDDIISLILVTILLLFVILMKMLEN